MCSLLWILSIFAISVSDVWTGTLQRKGISSRTCRHCADKARCEPLGPPVLCPAGQPLCATVATSPNFTSVLTCAAASDAPCSLIYKSSLALEMTCTCVGQLCSAPFAPQFRNELINFSSKIPANTSAELTETFLKSSFFANVTKTKLYKAVTIVKETPENQETTTYLSGKATNFGLALIGTSVDLSPRAEPLKHEATVPPDDDEDEGEGSGNIEDTKSQAAAPAAPSSYLPAEENNVARLIVNVYLLAFTTFYSFEIL